MSYEQLTFIRDLKKQIKESEAMMHSEFNEMSRDCAYLDDDVDGDFENCDHERGNLDCSLSSCPLI